MKILYGVCAWGLGHATRSLPVLRRLAAEHEVLVYSDGAALAYLRRELGARAAFLPATLPYPNIFAGRPNSWIRSYAQVRVCGSSI